MGAGEGGQRGSSTGLGDRGRNGLFRGFRSQVDHVAVQQPMSGVGRPVPLPIELNCVFVVCRKCDEV